MLSAGIASYCFFCVAGAFIIVKNVATPVLLLVSNGAPLWYTNPLPQICVAGLVALIGAEPAHQLHVCS